MKNSLICEVEMINETFVRQAADMKNDIFSADALHRCTNAQFSSMSSETFSSFEI